MKPLKTLAALLLATPCLAQAQQGPRGHLITVIGHPDRDSFSEGPERIKETLSSQGYSHGLILGRLSSGQRVLGDWNFADKVYQAGGSKAALYALELEAQRVRPGAPLILNVGNHGLVLNTPGYGPTTPGTVPEHSAAETGIAFSPQEGLVWPSLIGKLRGAMPAQSSLKVIASACFSGGVHFPIRAFPGTCGIASSDYQSPSFGTNSWLHYDFHETISKQIASPRFDPDRSGKSSLMEAYFYVESQQFFANGTRSTLSSFDFVEWFLQEGVHMQGRCVLSDWKQNVGAVVDGCTRPGPGTLILDLEPFKSFEQVCLQLEKNPGEADWNLIPEPLRKIYDSAMGSKGLAPLSEASESLSESAFNDELNRLKQEWENAQSSRNPKVKSFEAFRDGAYASFTRERDRLEESAESWERADKLWSQAHRDALEELKGAWFFKKHKEDRVAKTSAQSALTATHARNSRLQLEDWVRNHSDEEKTFQKLQREMNESIASTQKKIRARFEEMKKVRLALTTHEARTAVLRERMNRVARFMASAPQKTRDRYLEILRCELEDL